MRSKWLGPFLVGVAAVLWSTDALFRVPAVAALNPAVIVFVEHLIGVAFLLPFLLITARNDLLSFQLKEWMILALVGVGGSGFATILFTASFRLINPSVAILLQKLQPLIVVVIAYLFLGERPHPKFYPWALLALASAVVLSFPDFHFSGVFSGFDLHSRGVIFAATAATLWAIATVAGKVVLRKHAVGPVTFWRYAFGLWGLMILLLIAQVPLPWPVLKETKIFESLLYMSLFPGVLAMVAYYSGLSRTPASTATFIELLFPVGAVMLNWKFLNAPLSLIQIAASGVLLFAVARISTFAKA